MKAGVNATLVDLTLMVDDTNNAVAANGRQKSGQDYGVFNEGSMTIRGATIADFVRRASAAPSTRHPARHSGPNTSVAGVARQAGGGGVTGGGVLNAGTMTISGATIANNSAGVRRALDRAATHARVALRGSHRKRRERARQYGAGVYNRWTGHMAIGGATIASNSAAWVRRAPTRAPHAAARA